MPTGDATEILRMGIAIEEAGWDAAFGWEAVYGLDPWALLGGIAGQTSRIRLGTLLTPPSRRRPWKLASEVATLDRLSNGRAILAVGLGALDTGFASVGEQTDRNTRAELFDEALERLELFWSNDSFTFTGKHDQIVWDSSIWKLEPVQKSRVPIWVVGAWPNERSMARTYRWNGVLPFTRDGSGTSADLSPAMIDEIRLRSALVHNPEAPRDMVIECPTPAGDADALNRVRDVAAAGATWWIGASWRHRRRDEAHSSRPTGNLKSVGEHRPMTPERYQ